MLIDGISKINSGTPTKNLIIGGNFDTNPWQRGTSFSAVANATYTADRWRVANGGGGFFDVAKVSSAPTVAQAGAFVQNCLGLTVSTADTSIAAGDFYAISQRIEGYIFAPLAQTTFTLSFWVRATVTGTYCVSFNNSGFDRSYVAEYTINSASTWEYKTITVSASPSAGTWDYTSGIGLNINFILAIGSTWQTTAGSWATGNFWGTSNQVNAMATASNIFQLALVQLEAGHVATSFEKRKYVDEHRICQRYYYAQGSSNGFYFTKANSDSMVGCITLPTMMRTSPTITLRNGTTSDQVSGFLTGNINGTFTIGRTAWSFYSIGKTSAFTSESAIGFNFLADSEL